MDRIHEGREHWRTAGTLAFWIIVYFWVVWFFNQMLPPVPEQTPLERLLQQQVGDYQEGGNASRTR
jgi:hypothetical protein